MKFSEVQEIRDELNRILEFYPEAKDYAESIQNTLAEIQINITRHERTK